VGLDEQTSFAVKDDILQCTDPRSDHRLPDRHGLKHCSA